MEENTDAGRGRFMPRPAGLGLGAIGLPASGEYLNPMVGQVLAIAEIITLLVVVSAALFGARHVSERAFRLLRWCADHPEPRAPSGLAPAGTASAGVAQLASSCMAASVGPPGAGMKVTNRCRTSPARSKFS